MTEICAILAELRNLPGADPEVEALFRRLQAAAEIEFSGAISKKMADWLRDSNIKSDTAGTSEDLDPSTAWVHLGELGGEEFEVFADTTVTIKLGKRVLFEDGLYSNEDFVRNQPDDG